MNSSRPLLRHTPIGAACLATLLFCGISLAAPLPRLVWPNSPTPTSPYDTWDTAAHHITNAVDGVSAGQTIIVTNGTYFISETIFLGQNVKLRSVNGSAKTVISGNPSVAWIQCVNMAAGSLLDGFTVTLGLGEMFGDAGGVYCEGGTIQNCSVIRNSGENLGGVALENGAVMRNCIVATNDSWLGDDIGVGVDADSDCIIENCTIVANGFNSYNCHGIHLSGNPSTVRNCIVYDNIWIFNMVPVVDNWGDDSGSTFENSCTTPDFGGTGCIDVDPQLTVSLRPQATEVIDTGSDQGWMSGASDLAGYPRILGTSVDMGAYESATNDIILLTTPGIDPVMLSELDFGVVTQYYDSTLSVIVRNLGHATLDGNVSQLTPPFGQTKGSPSTYTLGWLEETTIPLTFSPITSGEFENVSFFSGSGTNLLLKGTGVLPEPMAGIAALVGCLLALRRR